MKHGKTDSQAANMKVKDPVCGMEITPSQAEETRMYEGKKFYFCSASCAKAFDKDPHAYVREES